MSNQDMYDDEVVKRYLAYKNDPWKFLTECVFTRDAVDQLNPVKMFPDYDYLKYFTYIWLNKKRIAVPKSRRMTMSWTCIALTLWDCIFHPGREWAFASKKEDDAAELVARAQFIFRKIPPDKIPKALLPTIMGGKMTKSPPRLEFDFGNENTSYIYGSAMGADQLRQFTFSGIFGDECAFWPEAEEFYTGAKPTTDGGGRMVLVSSRSPGFFKRIVFDQINAKDDNFPEIAPTEIKYPMQGMEVWTNPQNKFTVVDIHYTAHPDKRSDMFREELMSSLPLHQFMREYERSWKTFTGQPIYPNFRDDIHIAKRKRLEPHLGLPLLFGWDFGHTPACIVGQLQGNSLKIIREYTAKNESIRTFAPKVMNEVNQLYPQWNDSAKQQFHFIDPNGFKGSENDMRTCAMEMMEFANIHNIEPGPVTWQARKTAVENFLLYIEKDGAGLEFNADLCPVLVEGMKGGYRYADSVNELQPDKVRPIKNFYSHVQDALQYICWGAAQKRTNIGITNIPIPQYKFGTSMNNTSKGSNNYGRRIKS